MGVFSDSIRAAMALNFVSGRKNTAANARAVVGTIADAVAALEGLQRGARILSGAGVPAGTVGIDGDAYINTSVSDLYLKSAGAWSLRLVLRGNDGASAYQSWKNAGNQGTELAFVLSLRGSDGRSAYQSWQLAGNIGSEVEFVTSLAGRSAYQSWLATGNAGTEAQFVASLKAKDGEQGQRGNRITANATAPNSGEVMAGGGDLDVIGAGTTFADRIPGDIHFQTLSAERFRLWYQDRGTWVTLYTTPQGATVADSSVTNDKLATDVKVGSLAAASNAYDQTDRAGLTSVEKFLVLIGGKFTNILQRLGASEAVISSISQTMGTLSGTVTSNTNRIATLEARPISTGGTGTSAPALTSSGLLALLEQGNNVTVALNADGSKVRVSASGGTGTTEPAGNGGHSIFSLAGNAALPQRAALRFRAGLKATDVAGETVVEYDPSTVPAISGAQVGTVINMNLRYAKRAPGSGAIIIDALENVTLGSKTLVTIVSTSAGDTLTIGAKLFDGVASSFPATLFIQPGGGVSSEQTATFLDNGGIFVGGLTNNFLLECIDNTPQNMRFIITNDPRS